MFVCYLGGFDQSNEVKLPLVVKSTFHMHQQGNVLEDTCAIIPFKPDSLNTCAYNRSSPLVIIIHGWSVRYACNCY